MRHGEAGEADSRRWPDDRQRPLTDAGRREHAGVAEALRRMGVRFERLLSSPLVRARETAEITARAYGAPAPELTELLGDNADPASTLAGLAAVEASALLCVGHEPTLSRLAGLLTSRDGSARIEMAKAGSWSSSAWARWRRGTACCACTCARASSPPCSAEARPRRRPRRPIRSSAP